MNSHFLSSLLAGTSVLLISLSGLAAADTSAPPLDRESLQVAMSEQDYDRVIALTDKIAADSPLVRYRATAFQRRGVNRFFEAKIKESIADFDAYLAIFPEEDPHHWQRGICYYYADEFEKGKAQFERHQTVNSQDVENAVFHFICAARAPGGTEEKARADFINIKADSRVPMTEIWALYAGQGTAEAVIAATQVGNPSEDELRNRLCYAHLYLGLYFEAVGQPEKSAEHIILASGKYRMDHYMGQVAQVHAKLRKLTVPEE